MQLQIRVTVLTDANTKLEQAKETLTAGVQAAQNFVREMYDANRKLRLEKETLTQRLQTVQNTADQQGITNRKLQSETRSLANELEAAKQSASNAMRKSAELEQLVKDCLKQLQQRGSQHADVDVGHITEELIQKLQYL